MYDELAGYGDAMRGALGTHDSAALPAVMFPIQKCEVLSAYWALGHVRVWLPRGQHQVAATSRWLGIGTRGNGRGV